MKFFSFIALLTFSVVAVANGGEHHAEGIPTKTIMYQLLNVTILVVGLYFLLKSKIADFYKDKKTSYEAAAQKAQAARKQAEDMHMQIKIKLSKLESTADETVSRAKAEASDMKTQMIAEANAISQRIKDEAALAAANEVEKAKIKIREQLIKESFALAKSQLETKVSAEDQTRLQSDFIQNIQVVQR